MERHSSLSPYVPLTNHPRQDRTMTVPEPVQTFQRSSSRQMEVDPSYPFSEDEDQQVISPRPRTGSRPRPGTRRTHRELSRGREHEHRLVAYHDGTRPATSSRSVRGPPRSQDTMVDDMTGTEPHWRQDDTPSRHSDTTRRQPGSKPPPAFLSTVERYDDGALKSAARPPSPSPSQARAATRLGHDEAGYRYAASEAPVVTRAEAVDVLRLPCMAFMASRSKNHLVTALGEFAGTAMFLILAFAGAEAAQIGVQASDTHFNLGVQLYVSLAFGFSGLVNVWIFFRISGGMLNPAVTLSMVLLRAITPIRALCLFVAQLMGALVASLIVRFLFPQPFRLRTSLSTGTSAVQGLFIEALLTAQLIFTILMLAKEKHRATPVAPLGIGLSIFIGAMAGGPFTGASLNPARSFGPCLVSGTFEPEHWIYWIGPGLGTLLAVATYKLFKVLEYEVSNPGADGDPENDPTLNPAKMEEIRNAITW